MNTLHIIKFYLIIFSLKAKKIVNLFFFVNLKAFLMASLQNHLSKLTQRLVVNL